MNDEAEAKDDDGAGGASWYRFWADHGGWGAIARSALAHHSPAWAGLGLSTEHLSALLEQLGQAISASGADEPVKRLHQDLAWAVATRRRNAGLARPASPHADPSARFLRTVPRSGVRTRPRFHQPGRNGFEQLWLR